MDYRVHINLFGSVMVLSVAAALALIVSTTLAGRAYARRGEQAAKQSESITVKGSTRQRVRSDRATWYVAVRSESKALAEAYATLEDGVAAVRGFLGEQGFVDAEIGLGAVDTTTVYARDAKGNETREVIGFALSRTFVVSTATVTRVHQAAGEVTRLLREGVLVISRPPEYVYTGLGDLRIMLLGAASQDARARAVAIASNAGGRVGAVRSVHMGVLQVTAPDSTEVSDYGRYDTGSIEKDVTAVVTATFGIERG